VSVFNRAVAGVEHRLTVARRRSRAVDHVWRAVTRYNDVLGGRLAAAIAYYGFFAVFALGLVAYSVFGFVLRRNAGIRDVVDDFLTQNLPFIRLEQIAESGRTIGVVGVVILTFTGIGWVEAIRSSQRLIHNLKQQPGNLVTRRLVDIAVLVGIFLLLGISVAVVDTLESLLDTLLSGGVGGIVLVVLSWLLGVLVNMVLAAALLSAVPRLRMSRRRLRPAVLFVAVGLTLLNTVGRYYVARTEHNPAYQVVLGAVGLLLYLYLLNQLLLFGAALAATSRHGRVVDLAADDPPAGRSSTRAGETGW
jgi:membrane protein